MARYIGIRWICCGWLLLCGLLQTVEAATRIPVSLPSTASAVSRSTSASVSNGVLSLGGLAIEGEYIPAATGNVPVRGILGGVEFGLNTVSETATGLLRANAATLLTSAAIAGLAAGIGWVMEDGVLVKKTTGGPVATSSGQYQWGGATAFFSSAEDACTDMATYKVKSGGGATLTDHSVTASSETSAVCSWNYTYPSINLSGSDQYTLSRSGNGCPSNSSYSSTAMSCVSSSSSVPVSASDSTDVAGYVGKQDPAWIKSLIQQLCAGATNGSSPDSCYKAMAAKSPVLTGPSSVSGGTTHSTSTVANADGTTSQTDTATSVNYGLTYGSDYIDANKTETTTVTKDGATASTTTTSDDPDTTTDDNKSTTPATCTSADCTAPAYTPLYTKTTDTKEAALDSYSSRVQALPIFSAVGGFFKVSVGGGCPVWSVNTSLDIIGANFPINLVMDEQCQGWFVSVASFAKYCIMIVAAFFAFRTAILD